MDRLLGVVAAVVEVGDPATTSRPGICSVFLREVNARRKSAHRRAGRSGEIGTQKESDFSARKGHPPSRALTPQLIDGSALSKLPTAVASPAGAPRRAWPPWRTPRQRRPSRRPR